MQILGGWKKKELTRALEDHISLQRHTIISKWENLDFFLSKLWPRLI